MMLEDGMLLFHGSYTPVEKIDLNKSSHGKDFGKGFYITSDVNQAKSFIRSVLYRAKQRKLIPNSQNYGFVSSFRFRHPHDELSVYTFSDANKEWLWFISSNRRSNLFSKVKHQVVDLSASDIIIGKVANDNTNPVIATYLNGLYGDVLSDEAVDEAIKRLMPDHLVDQYCFLTQKAVECLEFQEVRKYVVSQ